MNMLTSLSIGFSQLPSFKGCFVIIIQGVVRGPAFKCFKQALRVTHLGGSIRSSRYLPLTQFQSNKFPRKITLPFPCEINSFLLVNMTDLFFELDSYVQYGGLCVPLPRNFPIKALLLGFIVFKSICLRWITLLLFNVFRTMEAMTKDTGNEFVRNVWRRAFISFICNLSGVWGTLYGAHLHFTTSLTGLICCTSFRATLS